MLASQGSMTPVTPLFIEGLLGLKETLVLQAFLVMMALMVGQEDWVCVVLQVYQDLKEKMAHLALQVAQRMETLEMMVSLPLVRKVNKLLLFLMPLVTFSNS